MMHEYLLVVYGVLLWQVEQFFAKKLPLIEFVQKESISNVIRSMFWGGLVVVFDDEILTHYNSWAEKDYTEAPYWIYICAGFSIDVVRSFLKDRYLPKLT